MKESPIDASRDSSRPAGCALAAFVRLGEGDYHSRLAATHGVSVVLFSSPHCGTCRVWKRLLPLALDGVADRFFEVDVSEATGIARYYSLFHLPAIYLYQNGHFHAELECAASVPAIRQTTHARLAEAAREEP